jgi:hypothetical protein
MPVSVAQRSVGVIVSIVVIMVASVGPVWAQLSSLADTDGHTRAAAFCFVIAGLAGITGAVGTWLRTNWATAPMIVWIGATVLGIVAADRYLDRGTLIPVSFIGGPQAILVSYLIYALRRPAENALSQVPTEDQMGTPLLVLCGIAVPPIACALAVVVFAALPHIIQVAPMAPLPVGLLAFVIALWRGARNTLAKNHTLTNSFRRSLLLQKTIPGGVCAVP